MIKPSPDSTPLIRVDNRAWNSHVFVAGIDVGRALKGVLFVQPEENVRNPIFHADIDIAELMKTLGKVQKEDLEKAKEVIAGYIEIYKDDYTDV